MRALVTGATGFAGRVLCNRLVREGHWVRAAVRAGAGFGITASELAIIDDLTTFTEWDPLLRDIDVVFHLAGLAHQTGTDANVESRFMAVNRDATALLARAVAQSGVRRLVFVSTTKVSGESSGIVPFNESDLPDPHDAYARSKRDAESTIQSVTDRYTIIRPPLIYGPGVKANFLSLLRAVKIGIPFPRVENRRSLIYVENLADALIFVTKTDAAEGQTYFVSDGAPVSTADLIREIASAMGKRPRLLPFSRSVLQAAGSILGRRQVVEKFTSSLWVDTARIQAIGWNPPCTMRQGIEETVHWLLGSSA